MALPDSREQPVCDPLRVLDVDLNIRNTCSKLIHIIP
jgi:hypothetical protein